MVKDAKIISGNVEVIPLCYKRVPFVYAHGKLEDDLGTDIFYLDEGDYSLNDGLVAYFDFKPVRFHIYEHPLTKTPTGIVTYCDDSEACQYGRTLVRCRPDKF